ncbi:unnamed protein product [Chrysodeixis includens]|uniref:Uncharacterized protein n=1 Tax=Chrysodeixis includens TaxID=689277 RepID=A0A9N8Q367_CHRIL|nr:unnamed protein product [Chrysodeixis includens]
MCTKIPKLRKSICESHKFSSYAGIDDVEVAVSWVLKPQHRSRIMFQRFMPWWNAQKRKEIADKKEEDRLKELKAEEARKEVERQAEEERTEVEIESEKADEKIEVNKDLLETSACNKEVNDPKTVVPDSGHAKTENASIELSQEHLKFSNDVTKHIVDNTLTGTQLVANSVLDT